MVERNIFLVLAILLFVCALVYTQIDHSWVTIVLWLLWFGCAGRAQQLTLEAARRKKEADERRRWQNLK